MVDLQQLIPRRQKNVFRRKFPPNRKDLRRPHERFASRYGKELYDLIAALPAQNGVGIFNTTVWQLFPLHFVNGLLSAH
jgi:hypothetical protein